MYYSKSHKLFRCLLAAMTFVAVQSLLPLWAQDVRVESYWDSAGVNIGKNVNITIGDQVDMVISVSGNKLDGCLFPSPDQWNSSNLIVVGQRLDTLNNDKGVTVSLHTILTVFDEGVYSTGGMVVQMGPQALAVDSLMLTVSDVMGVDTTKAEIKDIAGVMKEPYTFWEIFRWILLVIVVAAVVWAILFVSKKLKKSEPIIVRPQAPPIPAPQRALNQLESLRSKGLWQSGKVKEYHTELTDIVREYLRGQYGIDSAEMTTDQTLDAFRDSRAFDTDSESLLRRILRTADMVKFAKAEPQPHEHDLSMKQAQEFVHVTSSKHTAQDSTGVEQ